MFRLLFTSVFALVLAAAPANAMCCGAKDKAAGKAEAKMQCMQMDMTMSDEAKAKKTEDEGSHAGMDMGDSKDAKMDHSKMAGCCCGCCGGKKSSS